MKKIGHVETIARCMIQIFSFFPFPVTEEFNNMSWATNNIV